MIANTPPSQKQESERKQKKKTRSFEALKRFVTLRLLLTTTMIFAVMIASGNILTVSYRSLKANKTADALGIFFLELEHQAAKMSSVLVPHFNVNQVVWPEHQRSEEAPALLSEYHLDNTGNLTLKSGKNLGLNHLKNLGVRERSDIMRWNSWKLGDKRFLVLSDELSATGGRLGFFSHPKKLKFEADQIRTNQALVYVLTRQGDLLYANSKDLTRDRVEKRLLVQRFIYTPLWQGQVELQDSVSGERSYGFFRELPETNVVLFAEIPAELVESAVTQEMTRLLKKTGTIVLVALILSQTLIWVFLRPMGNLSRAAETLAKGQFNIDIRPMSFGEVRILSQSMMNMVQGLAKRDRTITELLEEQREKTRLEGELKIANAIQSNLLPPVDAKIGESFLQVAIYEPAAEVAGDWYNYCYEPSEDRGVMVIVDISGHGAGSSMFTAMTAAVFEEFSQIFTHKSEPVYFFEALNRQLLRYGKRKWSATAQAVLFDGKKSKVEIFNAGHLAPLFDAGGPSPKFKPVSGLASSLLGVEESISLAHQVLEFHEKSQLVLYTDGVVERRDAKRRTYGVRRMIDFFNQLPNPVSKNDLTKLLQKADEFALGSQRQDDICVVTIRRAST